MQAVHELYSKGGEAVRPVGDAFPGCIVDNGSLYDHCCLDIAAVQRHVPHHHTVTLFGNAAVSRPLLGPFVVGNEVCYSRRSHRPL